MLCVAAAPSSSGLEQEAGALAPGSEGASCSDRRWAGFSIVWGLGR